VCGADVVGLDEIVKLATELCRSIVKVESDDSVGSIEYIARGVAFIGERTDRIRIFPFKFCSIGSGIQRVSVVRVGRTVRGPRRRLLDFGETVLPCLRDLIATRCRARSGVSIPPFRGSDSGIRGGSLEKLCGLAVGVLVPSVHESVSLGEHGAMIVMCVGRGGCQGDKSRDSERVEGGCFEKHGEAEVDVENNDKGEVFKRRRRRGL
jgi:hypothetical protein